MNYNDTHIGKYPELDIEFINPGNIPIILGTTLTSVEKPFSIGPASYTPHEIIRDAKQKLAKYLKTDTDKMIYTRQVHGDSIAVLDDGSDFDNRNMEWIGEYDGAITNRKGHQLNLSLADCGGVLMFLPESNKYPNTFAAVHSGWKGTKLGISEKAINKIANLYDTSVEEIASSLIVWLTPSASCDNYEVGSEFKEFFPNSIIENNGKLYFDNQKEICSRLVSGGVKEENIRISKSCTIADKNYHSYRRDCDKSGRMNAFIRLDH